MIRAKRVGRLIASVAPGLIAGGVALIALGFARRSYRRAQLFAPSREPIRSWNPEDYGIPRHCVTEERIETPDGEVLDGWYCRSPHPVASALFCHGNTGNLTTIAGIVPHLLRAGLNVLLFDYRGFGRSTGRPSVGGVVADSLSAAAFHDGIRPAHLPSILHGFSLGGAIAAQIAPRHPFDGLILQSTFTNLRELARIVYPRTPVHLVAGDLFDTRRVVAGLDLPLLILHGSSDEVVPCFMAHSLYDGCHSRKEIEIVEGGLHKDLFERQPDSLVRAINRFAAKLGLRAAPRLETSPLEGFTAAVVRHIGRRMRSRTAREPG